jgi:hypothetical protein
LVFSLSISFHQCSVLFFIYILLLPEGQARESWELQNKHRCSGHRKALDRKVLLFFFLKFQRCNFTLSRSSYQECQYEEARTDGELFHDTRLCSVLLFRARRGRWSVLGL